MDLREPSGRRELGRRIQSAVMGAGHGSLSAFAERLGCSRALIYQYVNGQVLVQLDRLQTIAELTGKPLEWFLQADPGATPAEVVELKREVEELSERVGQMQAVVARERGARLQQREQHTGAMIEAVRELVLAHRKAGDAQAVLDVAPRWLSLAQEAGDEQAAMNARLQMAHAWYETGDMDRARDALGEVVGLAGRLANKRAEESARQELVRVLKAAGHTDEAREEATRLAESERWWPRWSARVSLAAVAEQTGELAEAGRRLDEAEALVDEASAPEAYQPLARAYVLSNRVNIALARGRHDEALKLNATFRSLAERAGLPDQMREAALNEAICHVRSERLEEAGEQLERLHEWALHLGDRRIAALTDIFESERLRRGGDPGAAKRVARAAVDEANGGRSGQILAEAELALGQAHLAEGQPEDARYYLEKCLSRASSLQLRRLTVAAQLALALTGLVGGEAGATERLAEVADVASALGYEDLHREAAASLAAADKGSGKACD